MSDNGKDRSFDPSDYREAFNMITAHILANSGTREDAREIMQEAVLTYMEMKTISENAKPSTILFSIAKNHWFNALRRKKKSVYMFKDYDPVDESPGKIEEKKKKEKYRTFVEYHIKKMTEICREILSARLDDLPYELIQMKLGFENIENVYMHYHRCKNRLKERLFNDRKFQEFLRNG